MNNTIQHFGRNTAGGRDLIVGDIHGCYGKLRHALAAIGFNEGRDRLFSVGDLVDRGPESREVLDWLAKPWFHAVRGNHEEAAIAWARAEIPPSHYRSAFGGGWNIENPPGTREALAQAFDLLPIGIELETARGLVGILHADCPSNDWDDLRVRMARGGAEAAQLALCCAWARTRAERLDTDEVSGVRAVVVGHTPFERMTSLGNVLFIDTFAWLRGHFTILDAETLQPAEAPPSRVLDWTGADCASTVSNG